MLATDRQPFEGATESSMKEIKLFNGHAPLPYRQNSEGSCEVLIGEARNSGYDAEFSAFVAHPTDKEQVAKDTAIFIKHACNSYYENQARIAQLEEELELLLMNDTKEKMLRSLLKQARGSVYAHLERVRKFSGVGVENSETLYLAFLLKQIDEVP